MLERQRIIICVKKLMNEHPIIFLDIDEVLNNQASQVHLNSYRRRNALDVPWMIQSPQQPGDWVHVRLLNRLTKLIDKHDCKVIIISAWLGSHNPKDIEQIFGWKDVVLDIDPYRMPHVIQMMSERRNRGYDVLNVISYFNIKRFCTIDDAASMYEGYEPFCNLVHVNGRYGLMPNDIELAEAFITSEI